ncbi:MAG: aminotransferase [Nitrospirales bacterium]|nr:MAG: aminotransferase [Nitrospirales bacterium]
MKLATRTTKIAASPTLHMVATVKALKAQGETIFDFAAGEPAQHSPECVKQAALEAIQGNFTKYTAVTGIDDLKDAIIETFQRTHRLDYDRSKILVSCGAKHTLYNFTQAALEAGDEIIIPSPYWVSYPDQIALTGATSVILKTEEASHYAIDSALLDSLITPRTKAIMLNSPCNPTGSMYDQHTLECVAELALRHDLLVVSDEIYEHLVYDGHQHVSIASLGPDIAKRTLVVNGASKSYSMTGWRIGYAAGPKDLITAMGHIQSQSTSNPNSIAQKATVAALRDGQSFITNMRQELSAQRTLMVDRLNAIPGITCPMPRGAFYALPNVSALFGRRHAQGTITSPSDLAHYLLTEAKVACVAGEPFGAPEHIRLSYTPGLSVIEQGMDRLASAIQALE